MLCGCVLQIRHGGDRCELASTLCKYDLGNGDLFVLSWERVTLMRGGGVRSILIVPLVARCLEIIDMCRWCMFVLCLFIYC